MANQISTELRNTKGEHHTPEEALELWVETMMQVYGKTKKEVLDFAIVKLEMERIDLLNTRY
jgi:hypothetical protein